MKTLSNPADTPQKKKKGGCLKVILSAIAIIIVIGVIISSFGGDDDSKKAESDPKSNTSDSTQSEPKKEQVVEEHYEVDLSAGNYTAGIDIPTGTYNLSATGGNGNVSSTNMYSGGLNEIMGNPTDEYSTDSFNGLKMDDGVVLTLGGTVTLHLTSENANVSGMTARSASDSAPIDLGSGNYTCGTDFQPGTYNIIATGGNGNVSSDNMFEGGINEVMGATNDGFSITQYNNASFKEGNVLTISGTSIQLVPVGK